jgi:hypothetical protein
MILGHDPIRSNRIMISSLCLSMISGQTIRVCPEENQFPLIRIMRQRAGDRVAKT